MKIQDIRDYSLENNKQYTRIEHDAFQDGALWMREKTINELLNHLIVDIVVKQAIRKMMEFDS